MKPQRGPAAGYLAGFGLLLVLAAFYPPGPFSWRRFLEDGAPPGWKIGYLAQFYLVPALLSFGSIVLFQVQMRMSMLGVRAGILFPVCVAGSIGMVAAWRTLVHGLASVPGYALGLAAAYCIMARVYALRPSRRRFFGRHWPVIVWRGNISAVQEIQQQMAAGRDGLRTKSQPPMAE